MAGPDHGVGKGEKTEEKGGFFSESSSRDLSKGAPPLVWNKWWRTGGHCHLLVTGYNIITVAELPAQIHKDPVNSPVPEKTRDPLHQGTCS